MHYRNLREAKNGDMIVRLDDLGHVRVLGILTDAQPGNDYCNGTIEPFPEAKYACLCDCLHVDDLAAMLKEKGLDKRPAGK